MGTADHMSEREKQDLRDAGRGHLVDGPPGGSLADRADAARKLEREEGGSRPPYPDLPCIVCGADRGRCFHTRHHA